MSLDVGEKRIGIAISDPLYITAQPFSVLKRSSWENDLNYLNNIIISYDIKLVVIGLPKQMNGSIGVQGEKIKQWGERFSSNVSVPIVFFDERLTTKESERLLISADLSRRKRKNVVDKLAASLILEQYLRTINMGK